MYRKSDQKQQQQQQYVKNENTRNIKIKTNLYNYNTCNSTKSNYATVHKSAKCKE